MMFSARLLTAIGLAALLGGLSACGGGSSGSSGGGPIVPVATPTPASLTTTATISAAQGGTVALPDGASVTVPAGFLTTDGPVTLTSNTQAPPAPIPGAVVASNDVKVTFGVPVSATVRQPRARPQSTSGDLIVSIPVPNGNLASIQQASIMAVKLNRADGSSDYISPDATIGTATASSKRGPKSLISVITGAIQTSLNGVISFNADVLANDLNYYPPLPAAKILSPPGNGGTWSTYNGGIRPNKRTLVFVHGIFSDIEGSFDSACASHIAQLGGYDQVLGFNYDWTLSASAAAGNFRDFLNGLPTQSWLDIEAHSYGTIVTLTALPNIRQPVKNVILLNGPLPLNAAPIARKPWIMRSIGITLASGYLGSQSRKIVATPPQLIAMTAGGHTLDSLTPGSPAMNAIVATLPNVVPAPKYIEVGGTLPYTIVKRLFNSEFTPPYDGIVELASANSTNFYQAAAQHSVRTSFPLTHTDLPCNDPAAGPQQFVASSLMAPVVSSVASLTFTQTGPANSQHFTVSQLNHSGAFVLSGLNSAVATAQSSGDTITVTAVGSGSTSLTVTGSDNQSVTLLISVGVTIGQLTASVSSLSFTQVGAANAQHFTVSQANYSGAFGLQPGINSAVATAQISGNTITVTPVAAGSTSVTVAGGGGQSVTVPISVSPSPSMTLATGLSAPAPLYLQSGYLYIADVGSLDRVPVGGGSLQQLATGQTAFDSGSTRGIDHIAFSGANVYYGFGGYVNYFVKELPNGAGPAVQIATPSGGDFIGVIGAGVYYSKGFCCIAKQPLGGGSETTVLSGVWIRSFAVDDTAIYFVEYNSKNVDRFDVSTGTLTPLITGNSTEGSIVADQQNVYFSQGTSIGKISKQGDSLTTIYTGGSLQMLAADGIRVFFAENGNLKSVPTSGGAAQTLVSGAAPAAAVSDGTYVYWANSSDPGTASVYRLQL